MMKFEIDFVKQLLPDKELTHICENMTEKRLEEKRRKLNVCDKKLKDFVENMKKEKNMSAGDANKNIANIKKEKESEGNMNMNRKDVIKKIGDTSSSSNNNNGSNVSNNIKVMPADHAPLLPLVAMNPKALNQRLNEDIQCHKQDMQHSPF